MDGSDGQFLVFLSMDTPCLVPRLSTFEGLLCTADWEENLSSAGIYGSGRSCWGCCTQTFSTATMTRADDLKKDNNTATECFRTGCF